MVKIHLNNAFLKFLPHRRHVSITKTNRLTLFTEIILFLFCENHTKHANALYGQNAELFYLKTGGVHSNH
jgi:hypothetical protein